MDPSTGMGVGAEKHAGADLGALNAEFGGSKGTLGQIADINQKGQQGLADIQSGYARDTASLARQSRAMESTVGR